jgi:hypothetical protein
MSGKPVVDQVRSVFFFSLSTDSDFFQSPTPEVVPLLEQRAERAQLEFLPSCVSLFCFQPPQLFQAYSFPLQ